MRNRSASIFNSSACFCFSAFNILTIRFAKTCRIALAMIKSGHKWGQARKRIDARRQQHSNMHQNPKPIQLWVLHQLVQHRIIKIKIVI